MSMKVRPLTSYKSQRLLPLQLVDHWMLKLLMKMPYTLCGVKDREIKLALIWVPIYCWLAFIILTGARQAA